MNRLRSENLLNSRGERLSDSLYMIDYKENQSAEGAEKSGFVRRAGRLNPRSASFTGQATDNSRVIATLDLLSDRNGTTEAPCRYISLIRKQKNIGIRRTGRARAPYLANLPRRG
jgi:hypothetical protein